ncbi:hypothetical protein [Salimicrobium flavidum]|uniref:Uncharacterized protein n=1 Tax=Salimicrobium flavidum TaxID=570947 RepID=A0A1N7KPI1_9BACI|nr:hypothetical protein [Salimicrobium flavidum]SIS63330.1 hypothetical protein SAMN05421687_11510 [Salimicrobium flavidum]
MKLSFDEELILKKICKQQNIPVEVMGNIFTSARDHYYSSKSNEVLIDEILQEVEYQTKRKEG